VSQLDAYTVDPVFKCHRWTGKLGGNGRPVVWRGRTPVNAYKLAYEAAFGPVKDGMQLDHLCRRATGPNACINPQHLEPVTPHENALRKAWSYRCKRRQCAKGHDMSTAMVTPEMGRLCRTCHEAM